LTTLFHFKIFNPDEHKYIDKINEHGLGKMLVCDILLFKQNKAPNQISVSGKV